MLNFEDAAPTPNQATVGRGIVKGAEKKPQGQITSSPHPFRTCFQKEGTSGDPAPLPPPAGGEGETEAQPTLLAEEQEVVVAMAAHQEKQSHLQFLHLERVKPLERGVGREITPPGSL